MKVLVAAEQRDGTLNRASWETVAAAQQTGAPVTIVVAGSGIDAGMRIVVAVHRSTFLLVTLARDVRW